MSDRFTELLADSNNKVTITTNEVGQCVAVTITNSEGQVLAIMWEAPPDMYEQYAYTKENSMPNVKPEITDEVLRELYLTAREDTLEGFLFDLKKVLNGYKIAPYYPVIGSKWKHRKGDVYTVLGVTSSPDEFNAEKFPISVFYEGSDGRRWVRTLESWKKSFIPG